MPIKTESDDAEHLRKIFIGGLTPSTSDEVLSQFYSRWGELTDCVVMRDNMTKRSRGFGFVTYADASMCAAAMANLPHIINGKKVDPKQAMPREQSQNMKSSDTNEFGEPEHVRKIFIGGLTLNTTDDTLRTFYSQWGDLVDCVVMSDSDTGRSRGFGFVTYARAGMLDEAMNNRPHVIDGKTVDPKRAVPKDQAKPEAHMSVSRLYVSGVKPAHTDDIFREYFGEYGTVTDVSIPQDPSGNPRGFAFVSFDDYDSVDKAVQLKSHEIAGCRCDVKKALSKEEMAAARDREARSGRSRGGGGGGDWAPRGGGGGRGGRGRGRGGGGGMSGGGYGGGQQGGYGGGGGQDWNQGGYGGAQAGNGGGWAQGGWNQQGGYGGGAGGYGGQQAGGGYGGGYGGQQAAAGGGYGAQAGYGGASGGGWAQQQQMGGQQQAQQGGWGGQQQGAMGQQQGGWGGAAQGGQGQMAGGGGYGGGMAKQQGGMGQAAGGGGGTWGQQAPQGWAQAPQGWGNTAAGYGGGAAAGNWGYGGGRGGMKR